MLEDMPDDEYVNNYDFSQDEFDEEVFEEDFEEDFQIRGSKKIEIDFFTGFLII